LVEVWLGLAALDMVAWGIGQAVVKRATDRLGPATMVLIASVLDGSAYAVLYVAFGGPFAATWDAYAVAALASIVGMGGYILYYEALLRGSVAVVGTITAGSPILTVLGGMLIFGETPTLAQGIGVLLLVVVVLILGYEPTGADWRVPVAVVLSLAILILWGTWGLLTKAAVEAPGLGPWNLLLFYTAANVAMGPPYYAWRRRRASPVAPSRRVYGTAVLGLALLSVGIVAATVALAFGPVSLVSAVSGCGPVVTGVLAFTFLKERVTRSRVFALLLFVPGIVLVAL